MEEFQNMEVCELLFSSKRYETYKNWRFDKEPDAICTSTNLARAGFIMDPSSRTCTRCVFCGKTLEWDEPTEDPFEEHRAHSPACVYVPYMNVDEDSLTIEQSKPLFAALCTENRMQQVYGWVDECDLSFRKVLSRLTPYLKNAKYDTEEA